MADELTRLPPVNELRDVLIAAGYNLRRVRELIDDEWLAARQFTWDDVTREIGSRHKRLRFLKREQRVLRVKDATGVRHTFRFDGTTFVRQLRGSGCPRRTSVRTLRPAGRRRVARTSGSRGDPPHPDDDPDDLEAAPPRGGGVA